MKFELNLELATIERAAIFAKCFVFVHASSCPQMNKTMTDTLSVFMPCAFGVGSRCFVYSAFATNGFVKPAICAAWGFGLETKITQRK